MTQPDAWRAAIDMRNTFANDAASVAASRADHSFDVGDFEGFRVWSRITRTILEMERPPEPCDARH